MNSRERYIRALTFDHPDRVPVMHHSVAGAFRAHGRALEELYVQYPSDVLGSFTFSDSPRGRWSDGQVTCDDWGCRWLWNTPDYMGQTVHHPLADWAALDDYRPPDPTTGIDGVRRMSEAVEKDGHRRFVFADGGEIFQRMFFLRGMENLLVDLHEDRPEVYILRDMIVEFYLKRLEIWLETGQLDAIILRDDWGSQAALMVRPEIWRKVFKPAYARLVDATHAGGLYASFHSDGVIAEILSDLLELGWDELNPQVHLMDIETLGRQYGGKVCVRADIDRQWTLPHGSPEDVTALIRRLFDAFGRSGGGYVGWGEMAADVPLANGAAMLRALFDLRYDL